MYVQIDHVMTAPEIAAFSFKEHVTWPASFSDSNYNVIFSVEDLTGAPDANGTLIYLIGDIRNISPSGVDLFVGMLGGNNVAPGWVCRVRVMAWHR